MTRLHGLIGWSMTVVGTVVLAISAVMVAYGGLVAGIGLTAMLAGLAVIQTRRV